jgi:hypothetical protein
MRAHRMPGCTFMVLPLEGGLSNGMLLRDEHYGCFIARLRVQEDLDRAKTGSRFSTKEAIPSLYSWVPKQVLWLAYSRLR